MDEEREILVAGAGPAGTAAAALLRQRGHDVLLIDAAQFPRDKICGESISAAAWPVLEEMGAAARVAACQPRPVLGWKIVAPDGSSFCGVLQSRGPTGFTLRRETLDLALLDSARAAGAEVRLGTQAVAPLLAAGDRGAVQGLLIQDADGPRRIRARLVVIADGRQSRVARRLGLLREDRSRRKFAVRGYWRGVEGLGEHGEMHVAARSYCGVAPLDSDSNSNLANVTFVVPQQEMSAASGDLRRFYLATLGRWPQVAERLQRAELLGPPRAVGPLALTARALWVPGALLVGDAAGFYDPFTGDGVASALRSGLLAAETAHQALRRGGIPELSDYARRRREETRLKLAFDRLIQRAMARPAVARFLVHRIACRPALANRLVGFAGGGLPAREAFGPAAFRDLFLGRR